MRSVELVKQNLEYDLFVVCRVGQNRGRIRSKRCQVRVTSRVRFTGQQPRVVEKDSRADGL